ncbi:MAG: DUF4339 domain-containing protein, partial [Pirellula sp.]
MGIRFSCHMCNQPLHVKDFQAGKRGKCPQCQGSFRVPAKDADFSLAVEESAAIPVTAKSTGNQKTKSNTQPSNKPKPEPRGSEQSLSPRPNQVAVRVAESSSAEIKPIAPSQVADPTSMPPSLLPLVDARWFVRPPSGGQYGPATTQMLLDWIVEKRVTADSLLWRDGLDTWYSARELVPEPFGGLSAGRPSTPADIPPPAVVSPAALAPKSAETSPRSVSPLSVSPPSGAANKAAIAMKKKKQLKQQWIVLGFLATMALCLVIALIVILTRGA